MFPTQFTISAIAERIRAAYLRRHAGWRDCGVSPSVWSTAASGLCLLNGREPMYPIDPELFVAAQPSAGLWPDPWTELASPKSFGRYRRSIRNLVRQLRRELRVELRRAERRLIRGESIDLLLDDRAPALSPMGCYVLAHQAGRDDLIDRFRRDASKQHLACPLYRQACLTLLPDGLYPEPDFVVEQDDVDVDESETGPDDGLDDRIPRFSLN
ncbi:MAG: hypothetical protein SFX72_15145 [Isosphaeraceae bacterium]|nr:hypothetical protein [Isosphaeraceae bacterium]